MVRPIAYDITRLAVRLMQRTPNGIDRIDSAFAQHFINPARPDSAGMMLTPLGPRLIPVDISADIVESVSNHWGEQDNPDQDESYRRTVDWINGRTPASITPSRISSDRRRHTGAVFRLVGRHGIPLGHSPSTHIAKNAIYLNTSQLPLWNRAYFGWMKNRPDVKPVFFIHDLLPIEMPEYFPKGEYARHLARLKNLAEFGAAAIVASETVKRALMQHLKSIGRAELQILVAPPPAKPIFFVRDGVDPDLLSCRYFVVCGTIEPRKNHLMLLQIWRELVRQEGAAAPKLLIIGNRGWENQNVVGVLERSRTLSNHVLEISGVSTPSLKRLLAGACALLMPTFAEGFGLPVVEGLAAGIPVIASNLEVFREMGAERITLIDPIDGEAWLKAIRVSAESHPAGDALKQARGLQKPVPDLKDYFFKIDEFLTSL